MSLFGNSQPLFGSPPVGTDLYQRRPASPDFYAAREPSDEAPRLAGLIGPAQRLGEAGYRAMAEDVSQAIDGYRTGQGVR